MKWMLLVVATLCTPSLGVCNPGAQPYDVIYTDVGSGSSCLWPAPGETFTVTLYLGRPLHALQGVYGIQLDLERTFGGSVVALHNLFEPVGGLTIGSPEVWPGFAMTTGPCAVPNSNYKIPFATVTYLYTGPPGTLTPIAYQAGDGGIFIACNQDMYEWDILWSGPGSVAGIGMEAPYPYGCGGAAVQDMTWGAIKAMYR